MQWFKHYDGMVDDPKWLVVAAEAGAPRAVVSVTFAKLCEHANKAAERGSIAGFDARSIAIFFETSVEVVERVIAALRTLGLVVGNKIRAWAVRQGLASAQVAPIAKAEAIRKRRERERKRFGGEQITFDLGVQDVTAKRDMGVTSTVTSAPKIERKTETEEDALPSGATRAREAQADIVNLADRRGGGNGRRARISENWLPDERGCQFAIGRGYDERWIGEQAERFRDHFLAKGECRADWAASWRTWVQRAADFCVGVGMGGGALPYPGGC